MGHVGVVGLWFWCGCVVAVGGVGVQSGGACFCRYARAFCFVVSSLFRESCIIFCLHFFMSFCTSGMYWSGCCLAFLNSCSILFLSVCVCLYCCFSVCMLLRFLSSMISVAAAAAVVVVGLAGHFWLLLCFGCGWLFPGVGWNTWVAGVGVVMFICSVMSVSYSLPIIIFCPVFVGSMQFVFHVLNLLDPYPTE